MPSRRLRHGSDEIINILRKMKYFLLEKEAKSGASFCLYRLKSLIFSAFCRFFDILYMVFTICVEHVIVNSGCNNFVIISAIDVTFGLIDGGQNA